MRISQSLRGLKAHERITRPSGFCASHDPEEGETELHTARFWTSQQHFPAASSSQKAQPAQAVQVQLNRLRDRIE